MEDWQSKLAELYKGYSTQQKNIKGQPHKGDSIENFRGKKGFNDVGIPLSPKAAKKQQRNRSNYKYPMHLQRINERRKKDAEDRWGIKPVPAARSSISERHGNRSSRWAMPTRSYDDEPTVTKKRKYSYYGESLEDTEPERVYYVALDEPREPTYKATGKFPKLDEAIAAAKKK